MGSRKSKGCSALHACQHLKHSHKRSACLCAYMCVCARVRVCMCVCACAFVCVHRHVQTIHWHMPLAQTIGTYHIVSSRLNACSNEDSSDPATNEDSSDLAWRSSASNARIHSLHPPRDSFADRSVDGTEVHKLILCTERCQSHRVFHYGRQMQHRSSCEC